MRAVPRAPGRRPEGRPQLVAAPANVVTGKGGGRRCSETRATSRR